MERHNHGDQLSKNILRDALNRAAQAETEVEVLAASQRIDVYSTPDPAREAERGQMGLLGELAAEPSLFEPFRRTPGFPRVRRCVCKQLTWHHELERRARAEGQSRPREGPEPPHPAGELLLPGAGASVADPRALEGDRFQGEDTGDAELPVLVPFPWLVIIGPGRPETAIELYGCTRTSPGLYTAVAGLQLRIVVLAELPRTRATLLLRLLGTGRVLTEALADFAALPEGAWEKGVALPILIHFGLEMDAAAKDEEEEMTTAEIRAWYAEYQKKQERLRDEARAEGRDEARAEASASAVLAVLRARRIAVPDAAREQILAERAPERLDRWLERAAVATSLAEVLAEPS